MYVWEKASRRNFRFHFVGITFLLRQFVQCVKWTQNHVYTSARSRAPCKLKRMSKNHRKEYWIHLFLFTLRCACNVCVFLDSFYPRPCWFHFWFDYTTLYTHKLVERCEIRCFPVEIFIWKSGMIYLKSAATPALLPLQYIVYAFATCRAKGSGVESKKGNKICHV